MSNHKIGSIWRKWDLHVHTPASIVQSYGGKSDQVWEKFVSDLEDLPDEFSVIGVNDYLFLDGYKKLLEFKSNNRLTNIKTLFPVIEFRLSKFAGHEKMLRVNYHVIFSEQLDPDIIEHQFLTQLRSNLNLSPEHASVTRQWRAVITKSSLEDLGRKIKESIPPERLHEYDESDFLLGFNNLNFDESRLVELLENSYLRGKYITAIGKSEWDQYQWNDSSIAEKKNIINSVDIVFTAASDSAAYIRGQHRLRAEGVNDRLFDCSDAHTYSNSEEKDRIGNCQTWIKADPTLDGLSLAIKDFNYRVYVGSRPPLLDNIDRHPANYIRRIAINRRQGYTPNDNWFDNVDIPLNPELIAVIGNRGMGKSALLDAIALGGNSSRPIKELSFLKQFQAARGNLAEGFEVNLEYYALENKPSVPLNTSYDPTSPSRVKHLPQHFIDVVCNEENDQFESEIERVVFSHVPEDERLGCGSLTDLIEYKSQALRQSIEDLRRDISGLNLDIASFEKELGPAHIAQLENSLAQKIDELRSMWENRPKIPPAPKSTNPELDEIIHGLREKIATLEMDKKNAEGRVVTIRGSIEAARRISALTEKLDKDFSKLKEEYSDDFMRIGLEFDAVISLRTNNTLVKDCEKTFSEELKNLRSTLNEDIENSLAALLIQAKVELEEAESTLSAPLQVYQSARKSHIEFAQSISELIGPGIIPDTIRFIRAKLEYIKGEAPNKLDELQEVRIQKTHELFNVCLANVDLIRKLYAPVQEFVDKHPPTDTAFHVAFSASLFAIDFEKSFSSHIAHNKRGTFYGSEQAHHRIERMLQDVDFNDWASVEAFLMTVNELLHTDKRPDADDASRQVLDQLLPGKSVAELYNFIFGLEYIQYRHQLTMGGRPLYQLSPGEKGALLLVFYLLVDQSDCPLFIDQPEENLDNQSVYKVLVPFIREARRRRQVVLVTHNPNIAVVAAAEQVIYCEMDKADGFRLKYESGALENPYMNQHVLDVLEGTRPAFSNREQTYHVSEQID